MRRDQASNGEATQFATNVVRIAPRSMVAITAKLWKLSRGFTPTLQPDILMPDAGLDRVSVASMNFSPIERLVMVAEPEEQKRHKPMAHRDRLGGNERRMRPPSRRVNSNSFEERY
jgi:hypothetical protein